MHTSAALAFKALADKIHPQLPLSPRDSQRLLNLLTTSFKRHLDKQHPTVHAPIAGGTSLRVHNASSSTPEEGKTTSSLKLAHDHLSSVLTNPLFSRTPSTLLDRQGNYNRATGSNIALENPVEWFEDHVAAGTATLNRATACLTSVGSGTSLGSRRSVNENFRETQAGSKVLKWLQTTQESRTGRLFHSFILSRLLTRALMAEGRRDVVLKWLHLGPPQPEIKSVTEDFIKWKGVVVRSFLNFDLGELHGANKALRSVLLLVPHASNDPIFRDKVLRKAVDEIVYHFGSVSEATKNVLPTLYDDFLATAINLHEKSRPRNFLWRAVLFSNHPKYPSPKAWSQFVDELPAHEIVRLSARNRNIALHGLLRATQGLLEREDNADALRLMQFMRQHFAQDLGLLQSDRQSVPREQSNLGEEELINLREFEELCIP